MKRRLFASTVVFAMCCAFPALSGDYRKGFEAYQKGDYLTALVEFTELGEQENNANAQLSLGLMYELGQGVPKDISQAAEWYIRAASQGKIMAQFRLGALYESGEDGAPDFENAMRWYSRAAASGMAAAQHKLGVAYHLGQGVEQNDKQAVNWLRRAANQGVTEAQIVLGDLLFAFKFAPHTNAPAYMWMSIAAASGDKTAKKKKRFFTIFMTPNQIVKGESQARDWKVKLEE